MRSRVYGALLVLWGRLPIPGWLRWVILWLFNTKFLVGVAAIIVNERGEVLLCHHTYRGDYPWDIPGGWLKRQEDPGRAIEREICEETGLVVHADRPVWSAHEEGTPALHIIYTARLVGGQFRPSAEVDEARFFPLNDMPELTPGEAAVIREALATVIT